MRQLDPRGPGQSHTFRGRSMQEAVRALKRTLGADAVIVGTRRGRGPEGCYVEITAVGQPLAEAGPALDVGPQPAMGGRRGASAAYAHTARSTQPAELPPLLAALRGEPPPEKPFAERAAWLARQIEQRTAEQAREPVGSLAGVPQRPPYHTVDRSERAPGAPDPRPAAASTPAGAAGVSRPDGGAPEVQRLRAEIDALKSLVGSLSESTGQDEVDPAPYDIGLAVAKALAPISGQLAELMAGRTSHEGPPATPSELRSRVGSEGAVGRSTAPAAVPRMAPDPSTEALVERLIDAGVPTADAVDVGRRARPRNGRSIDPLSGVAQLLADDIDCGLSDFDQRRVLAFVGPSGVGKTTTIAKLAAQARLAGRSVALITVDTFRMAAVEQLARYADVLDAPLRVVKSPEVLGAALDELSAYDVVLIDTTGRNPRAPGQVAALARFFPEGWGGELVLTVASSTRERDAAATVDAFATLGYAALCITKTDESDAPGAIYGIARRSGRPVAWLTDGPLVPDDIEPARAPTIAARIVAYRRRTIVALGA